MSITERQAQFQANLSNLDAIRTFIADFMISMAFPKDRIHNFQVSADEHVSNLIEHAFGGNSEQIITVTCADDCSKAQVIIADASEGFDPRCYSIPNIDENAIYELPPGGFGNYFICALMDKVDYIQRPNMKNELILTIYKK